MPPSTSNSGENRAMLRPEKQNSNRRRKCKPFTSGFIFGFILSTILALIAYGLSLGILKVIQDESEIKNSSQTCGKRIIGYHDLHSTREVTRNQISKFTHLMLFPLMVQENGTFGFRNDVEATNFRRKLRKFKQFNVKTMFSLWGGRNGDADVIRNAIEDPEGRLILLSTITNFIKQNNMDGVDIYWTWSETEHESVFFINFCEQLKEQLAELAKAMERRNDAFIVSLTLAEHTETYPAEFDDIWKFVDFMSIDTNNYHAPWLSTNGNLVGASSTLYGGHGKVKNQNLDHTMNYCTCQTRKPNRFNIMVEFIGRYWRNVNDTRTFWPIAEPQNGKIDGGWTAWIHMQSSEWIVSDISWNDESKTAYIWNPKKQSYITFENQKSIAEKIKYVMDHGIGGLSIWRFEYDDEDNTLLNTFSLDHLCSRSNTVIKYNCSEI